MAEADPKAASAPAADSWETLKVEELKLSDANPAENPVDSQKLDGEASKLGAPNLAQQAVDAALIQALADTAGQNTRSIVLRMEEDVLGFLSATERDVLEFPSALSPYQRMLAHKVAQYHGLHTATADYEGGIGRVVAHRRANTEAKPRLSKLEITPELLAQAQAAVKAGSPGTERPKLLRRASGADSTRVPSFDPRGSGMGRTPKEREEEYNRARERILGQDGELAGAGRGAPIPAGRAAPGAPAAFIPAGVPGGPPAMAMTPMMQPMGPNSMPAGGRGRGRKGAYRERTAEAASDPDYMRGMNRYGATAGFDANGAYMAGAMYNMPTYGTEFPQLAQAGSGSAPVGVMYPMQPQAGGTWAANGAYRPPPPPPPPSGQQGTPPMGNGGGSGKLSSAHSGSYPTTPTGGLNAGQGMGAPPPPPRTASGQIPAYTPGPGTPQAAGYAMAPGAVVPMAGMLPQGAAPGLTVPVYPPQYGPMQGGAPGAYPQMQGAVGMYAPGTPGMAAGYGPYAMSPTTPYGAFMPMAAGMMGAGMQDGSGGTPMYAAGPMGYMYAAAAAAAGTPGMGHAQGGAHGQAMYASGPPSGGVQAGPGGQPVMYVPGAMPGGAMMAQGPRGPVQMGYSPMMPQGTYAAMGGAYDPAAMQGYAMYQMAPGYAAAYPQHPGAYMQQGAPGAAGMQGSGSHRPTGGPNANNNGTSSTGRKGAGPNAGGKQAAASQSVTNGNGAGSSAGSSKTGTGANTPAAAPAPAPSPPSSSNVNVADGPIAPAAAPAGSTAAQAEPAGKGEAAASKAKE